MMKIGIVLTPKLMAYIVITLVLLYACFVAEGVLLALSVLTWGIVLAYFVGRDILTNMTRIVHEIHDEASEKLKAAALKIKELERINTELSTKLGVQPSHEATDKRSPFQRFSSGFASKGNSKSVP